VRHPVGISQVINIVLPVESTDSIVDAGRNTLHRINKDVSFRIFLAHCPDAGRNYWKASQRGI